MAPEANQDEIPAQVGAYKVVRLLGEGCMSRVYLAHDASEVRLAVKVCNPVVTKKHDWAGKLQTDFEHPNVMKYRALPFDAKHQYLVVTDYLEVVPATLESLRSRTFEEVVEIFAKVGDALEALAKAGITHGNVKPTNVLCRRTKSEFQPFLSDGGLRYVNEPSVLKGEVAARIFPYLAPEHLEAFAVPKAEQPGSAAGDVYSLMVTLAQALTGTVPFKLHVSAADDARQVLSAKRAKRYRIIFKNDATTPLDPRRMDELLSAAIDPVPENRPRLDQIAKRLRETIDRQLLAALSK